MVFSELFLSNKYSVNKFCDNLKKFTWKCLVIRTAPQFPLCSNITFKSYK